jgi:hypothetical protein
MLRRRGVGGVDRQPVDRVDVEPDDGLRISAATSSISTPPCAEKHQQVLLGRAVEREGGVVLLGDVRRGLDPEDLDRVALDVHAEDGRAVLPGLVGVVGQLDAAGFAPATDLDLGLDDDRVAGRVGRGDGLVDRVGLAAR